MIKRYLRILFFIILFLFMLTFIGCNEKENNNIEVITETYVITSDNYTYVNDVFISEDNSKTYFINDNVINIFIFEPNITTRYRICISQSLSLIVNDSEDNEIELSSLREAFLTKGQEYRIIIDNNKSHYAGEYNINIYQEQIIYEDTEIIKEDINILNYIPLITNNDFIAVSIDNEQLINNIKLIIMDEDYLILNDDFFIENNLLKINYIFRKDVNYKILIINYNSENVCGIISHIKAPILGFNIENDLLPYDNIYYSINSLFMGSYQLSYDNEKSIELFADEGFSWQSLMNGNSVFMNSNTYYYIHVDSSINNKLELNLMGRQIELDTNFNSYSNVFIINPIITLEYQFSSDNINTYFEIYDEDLNSICKDVNSYIFIEGEKYYIIVKNDVTSQYNVSFNVLSSELILG